MTITLLIIAAASIALNVFQYMERRAERVETYKLVGDHALLAQAHDELVKTYQNEKLHREWAVGRIQDQQAVISQLKNNIMPAKPRRTFRSRKEADNGDAQ